VASVASAARWRAILVIAVSATLVATGVTLAACSTSVESARIRAASGAQVAANFRAPWGLAFLPDGGALVTERDTKHILKVGPTRRDDRIVVATVATVVDAVPEGEGGLLGIAVSPQYRADGQIFIYYSARDDNRIARMRLGEAPQPIVTGIPKAGVHNGGRLGFGPDDYLYASTGDATRSDLAQDKSSLAGKILRMTPDGSPAPGNPFGNLAYSYGHRNVQGFAWTSDGAMYATEFGQNEWDELNMITAGGNYGWPIFEGKADDRDFEEPLVIWRPSEASPSGLAAKGMTLVVACLRGERLYLVDAASDDPTPKAMQAGVFGRLRTVVTAPDGKIWVTTSNRDGRGSPERGDDRILEIDLGPAAVSHP
jgi:glucose/arabinose dehydrogenase